MARLWRHSIVASGFGECTPTVLGHPNWWSYRRPNAATGSGVAPDGYAERMDGSNWINTGLLAATLLGVIVAAVAARQSRSSARDAAEAAEAGKRSTAALEEANELRRAAARKPRWRVGSIPERLATSRDRQFRVLELMESDRWVLTNDGPGGVTDVQVNLRGDPLGANSEGWGTNDFPAGAIEASLGGTLWLSRSRLREAQAVHDVTWCENDGTEREHALMLV